jgi:drug/metabolite transporter (DMT)-like permease
MLTLGVALVVYGFGEQNMNAELGWLLAGSVLFLIGYVLERRAGKGR